MRRKLGISLMALGAAMLLGAGSLFTWNQLEADRAEQASAEILPAVRAAIEENSSVAREETSIPGTPVELMTQEELRMTEVEIDGYAYIGWLTIPRLGLELPVMADWDYDRLKIAPCRFSGTTTEENLVLLGHNYRRHFGPIRRLRPGDEVIFEDMDGVTTVYQVTATDVVNPSALEEVTSGDFDLTLITCTYGGQTRIVVYCDAEAQGS